jgi:2-polyprenyl-6-hydroxyphenyl methylase/3-demethylubiquinone-9 3-methyltransferase
MNSPSSPVSEHSPADPFFDYYEAASVSPQAVKRFRAIRDLIIRLHPHISESPSNVADIGCGAGTQSRLWAEIGCKVHALDVNERLVGLGRIRSAEAGYDIDFRVGSAAALPWPDESMQVCLAVELLEHVREWQSCLLEFCRVLAPGGVLFASTSNALCPFQQEFTLPFYSWYPAAAKRYCERLAVTTRPGLANHAKYPAVNWFTFYQLRRFLAEQGFDCYDRFDVIDASEKGRLAGTALRFIRKSRFLRLLAYVATEGTSVVAVKRKPEKVS